MRIGTYLDASNASVRYNAQMLLTLRPADYLAIRDRLKREDVLPDKLKQRLSILLGAAQDPKNDPQIDGSRDISGPTLSWDYKDEQVRADIANIRKFLARRVWTMPTGRDCVFTVPERRGQPYRLVAETPSSVQRIWGHHLNNARDINVLLYERLFFRYKNAVYVRSTNINSNERRRQFFKDLPAIRDIIDDLKPSMHYVSSGELHAAIAVQEFFFSQFRPRTLLRIYQERRDHQPDTTGNDIVLAASRVGDPQLKKEDHESFQATEQGVEPGFKDNTRDPERRTIHVLLSRRLNGDHVKTVIQGSHGRGIQGACQYLTSESGATAVVGSLGLGEKRLPEQFQIVFELPLAYDQNSQVSGVHGRIKVCDWAPAKDVSKGKLRRTEPRR